MLPSLQQWQDHLSTKKNSIVKFPEHSLCLTCFWNLFNWTWVSHFVLLDKVINPLFHRLREDVKSGYDCQRTLSVGASTHSLLVPPELLEGYDVVHYCLVLTTSSQGSAASEQKTRGWKIPPVVKCLPSKHRDLWDLSLIPKSPPLWHVLGMVVLGRRRHQMPEITD